MNTALERHNLRGRPKFNKIDNDYRTKSPPGSRNICYSLCGLLCKDPQSSHRQVLICTRSKPTFYICEKKVIARNKKKKYTLHLSAYPFSPFRIHFCTSFTPLRRLLAFAAAFNTSEQGKPKAKSTSENGQGCSAAR